MQATQPGLPCHCCGRLPPDIAAIRAVRDALAVEDVDAALQRGLMALGCNDCVAAAGASEADIRLIDNAVSRLQAAWAARERHRARDARLRARAAKQRAARAPDADVIVGSEQLSMDRPANPVAQPPAALPTAAASALERALARARRR